MLNATYMELTSSQSSHAYTESKKARYLNLNALSLCSATFSDPREQKVWSLQKAHVSLLNTENCVTRFFFLASRVLWVLWSTGSFRLPLTHIPRLGGRLLRLRLRSPEKASLATCRSYVPCLQSGFLCDRQSDFSSHSKRAVSGQRAEASAVPYVQRG